MKSLFWKIFVSFWLALILFASLTLWATSFYLENIRHEANRTQPRNNTINYIDQVREIARLDDKELLEQWLMQLDHREAVPYLLLDNNGKDLLERFVPYYLQRRVKNHNLRFGHEEKDDDDDDDEYEHRKSRSHHRLVLFKGQYYHLMPDFRNITLTRVLHRPRAIATPIFLATIISIIICLLLARYITAPIGRLRHATQRLAKGELEQRVLPSMGKRKDEIVDLAYDFDHMAEKLQTLVESHKQLLRDASHELRSPLARLQVALGLARQRGDDKTGQELDRIEREAERLNELIGQLLTLARLDSGATEVEFEEIDLETMLEQIVDDAAYEAGANNRHVKITQSKPFIIKANSVLVSSALENIIRNAIRYTAEYTTVEVSLEDQAKNSGFVVIKVRDHGPGIPENMIETIFEPFVRVGEARDRKSGGYGLGLAIAKRAVDLHRGYIKATNEDEGVSVSVYLPEEKGK